MTTKMASPRVALYARVSTDSQTTENQLNELRDVAARNGWIVAGEYIDHGVSGAKGRDKRPEFDRLLKDAMRKEFDIVAAWSVDRLGRSLQHLVSFLGDIQAKGVGLYLHQQGVDTTTPSGKALFQMCGVFAEFERSMIISRVHAGLDRARSQGRKLGRPGIATPRRQKVQAMLAQGLSMAKIAKAVGCGVATVHRIATQEVGER
ncbi:recombinase family protein [Paraburkholderia flagellata]|uniref:recombinase family protein n=1 Tax=Paraburkholderia flagellata TaxID=2883241 RepID=UPI001F2A08FF|nr:recombinase family protein [Paraburkholderia flagellata]